MMDKYEKRFWSRVDMFGSYGCWEWQARCQSNGYGRFWDGKKNVFAHRYAWKHTNGEIPNDLCVLHHCDNPKCVNPNHLFLGTRADNNKDMVEKGRNEVPPSKGEYNGRSKLTKDDVVELRRRFVEEEIGQKELGKEYDILQSTVSAILRYDLWPHITDPYKDAVKEKLITRQRGEYVPTSKLTTEDVLEIRHRYNNGDVYQKTLAREFKVSIPTISLIVNNIIWKHVEAV